MGHADELETHHEELQLIESGNAKQADEKYLPSKETKESCKWQCWIQSLSLPLAATIASDRRRYYVIAGISPSSFP